MTLNISELIAAWQQLDKIAHDAVAPIEDEAGYDRALIALQPIWDSVGEDINHPLADLMATLITRIVAYQDVHHQFPQRATNQRVLPPPQLLPSVAAVQ